MDASLGVDPAEASFPSLGTRFRIFPQAPFVTGYERPETVWLSVAPGDVRPGPSDRRMYVTDPLLDKQPYQFPDLPPWPGDLHPPAEAGPDGHFDHIPTDTRAFVAAHAFACVRRVLDICESYFGREIPWFFSPSYERLEIIPQLRWPNAQSGFGFLELGEDDSGGESFPFALNFDAVAHETGHLVLFGVLGLPEQSEPTADYLSYHEVVADFISLICLLHFDTALDRVLRRTKGNLLIANELDRLAELTDEKHIRAASHSLKIGDVGTEVHDRSRPFTGALFDSMIEIFQILLAERGLASFDIRLVRDVRNDLGTSEVEHEFSIRQQDYEIRHFAVKAALQEARDIIGEALVQSWAICRPDNMSFRDAAMAVVASADTGRGRRFTDRILDNLAWRGIV